MSDQLREVRHLEPAWRVRSNFIIGADISSQLTTATREQLWARQVEENRFERLEDASWLPPTLKAPTAG